jgi:hypothetical protein
MHNSVIRWLDEVQGQLTIFFGCEKPSPWRLIAYPDDKEENQLTYDSTFRRYYKVFQFLPFKEIPSLPVYAPTVLVRSDYIEVWTSVGVAPIFGRVLERNETELFPMTVNDALLSDYCQQSLGTRFLALEGLRARLEEVLHIEEVDEGEWGTWRSQLEKRLRAFNFVGPIGRPFPDETFERQIRERLMRGPESTSPPAEKEHC